MTIDRFAQTRRKTVPAARRKRPAGANAAVPTLAEAQARLDAARDRPQPWLTPAAFEAAKGVPAVIGPEIYSKRCVVPASAPLLPPSQKIAHRFDRR